MTTYNKGYEASLAKYNARKRELRASMLEYSEHMRHIHSNRVPGSRKDAPGSSLEIRARGPLITRHSDPAFLPNRSVYKRPGPDRKRPSSLDEKELQNNAIVRAAPKRDTKSERAPVTIPTALPPLTDPPNSPDTSRKGNVRVSFVSTSDLYDIVDFGSSSKSPQKDTARIANVRDGLKLIEDLDLQNRKERLIAWESQPNARAKDKETIPPSKDDVSMDLITGKRIQPQVNNSHSKDSIAKNNLLPKLGSIPEEGKVVVTSDTEEIFPLNILLEQAAAHHLNSQIKSRSRPKRAKRMQLHKSSLLVIPEDGGIAASPGTGVEQSSPSQNDLRNSEDKSVAATLATSRTSSFFKDSSTTQDQRMTSPDISSIKLGIQTSKSNCLAIIRRPRLQGASVNDDKSRRRILKGSSNKDGNESPSEGRRLNSLIVTNSIDSPVPWETSNNNFEEQRINGKHVTFDTRISKVKARRKMKRLVFLQDHPEENYRQEM